VVEYVVDRERYRVALQQGNEVVSVKRDNLRAARGNSQSSAELKSGAKGRGNSAFQKGDYDLAIREFNNAIQWDAGDYVLYSNRSAAHACKQDYMAALRDAQQCVTLNPDFAKGYGRLAAANHCLGNFPGAIKAYKEGLRLDPSNQVLQKGLRAAETGRKETPSARPRPCASARQAPQSRGSASTAPQRRAEPDNPMEAFFADPAGTANEFFSSMTSSAGPPPGAQARSSLSTGTGVGARKRKQGEEEDCSIS